MNSNDSSPKLPMWVFFAIDAALLGTAWYLASNSGETLSPGVTVAIAACVIAGAIVALVPLVLHYERQKNEALDERQRALEGLARTVSGSAEQISIAAGGLHEIAELAQKNLRQAEHLPHKLQDKIAEFQSQLANAADAEKDELEKELAALRSSETERLETVADKLTRAAADLAKLEAATRQHVAEANEALSKLALGTANAIGKAQAAAEQALAHARTEASRALGEAAGKGARELEAARAAAVADFEARLAAAGTQLVERIAREAAKLAVPPAGPETKTPEPKAEPPAPIAAEPSTPPDASSASHATPPAAAETAAAPGSKIEHPPAPSSEAGAAPRRPRKPRRDEPVATDASNAAANGSDKSIVAPEPPPVPATEIREVAPVAPATAEPFAGDITTPVTVAEAEPKRTEPARKRAAKKPDPIEEPALDLSVDESGGANGGNGERVLSSDGATRLIVTAYIGIGNRLFIRGEGPGLSWDKGLPLQFVSIGKWRWETNDATGPVHFKLLKNDDQECAALGTQSLDPGHQHELTAAF